MSETQRKIAKYVMDNPEKVRNFSITQLARKVNVDPSSISRFCQFLGFKGYADFRFSISHHLVSPKLDQFLHYQEEDTTSEILKKMWINCRQIFQDIFQILDPNLVERAVKLIHKARAVYIFAAGGAASSALSGQKMLLHTGIPCHFYSDIIYSLPVSEHCNSEDTIIGISYSGEGKMVIEPVKNAKRKGASIIGITGFPNSKLTKLSDIPICYNLRVPDDFMYQHMVSMTEIMIIAALQNSILCRYHEELSPFIEKGKEAANLVRDLPVEEK
jgi:DNA-binding MurR/RpiR family transcriptional regulator